MHGPAELWGIRGVSALGIWISWLLSSKHWTTGDSCLMLGVPTCYLITILFAMILMNSFFFHRSCGRIDFDLAVGAGILLSIATSVGNALHIIQCPPRCLELFRIPHCYTEAICFVAILVLYRRIRERSDKTSSIE